MNTLLAILLPAAAYLLLALYGAGIFPWTVIAATVALCLGVKSEDRRRKTEDGHVRRSLGEGGRLETADCRPPTADCPALRSPFALLLLYLLIMLLPLPAGLPLPGGGERAHQNRIVAETLEAVSAAGVAHGVTPVFSLTRSRAGTLRFLLLVVLVVAGWRLAASAGTRQREAALRGVVVIGCVMALAGILGKWVLPQGDTLWWWIPIPHGRPGPMGGFMNRNHFAGFCAILAPAALALTAHDATQRRPLAALLNATAAAALAAGVLFSLSRGGIVALAAGLAALLLIGLLRGGRRTRLALASAVLILAAAGLALAWRQAPIRERLSSLRDPLATQSVQDRTAAWRDALRIWRQYPLLGAGPNAFRTVYPQHRTTSARDARDFAENEYVQWLSETGLAGMLIALLLAFHLLRDGARALRPAAPPGARLLATAAVAALVAAAVHALADFPLHLPLYALTVAALAGMMGEKSKVESRKSKLGRKAEDRRRKTEDCKGKPLTSNFNSVERPTSNIQRRTSKEERLHTSMFDVQRSMFDVRFLNSLPRTIRACLGPWLTCNLQPVTCLVIALALGAFDLQLDMDGRIGRAGVSDTARALAAAPTSPVAWRRLAALLWQTDTPPARTLAERALTQAAAYDPNNYPLWRRLGDVRRELGDNAGAEEAYRRVKALRSWVNVPTSLPEEN